jgi:hypothetical protein
MAGLPAYSRVASGADVMLIPATTGAWGSRLAGGAELRN